MRHYNNHDLNCPQAHYNIEKINAACLLTVFNHKLLFKFPPIAMNI